jgi:predicted transcriptional regulator
MAAGSDKKAALRKATAKDVALLAGVKQPTVSLALKWREIGHANL